MNDAGAVVNYDVPTGVSCQELHGPKLHGWWRQCIQQRRRKWEIWKVKNIIV
jgi:hypothetical protein